MSGLIRQKGRSGSVYCKKRLALARAKELGLQIEIFRYKRDSKEVDRITLNHGRALSIINRLFFF